jgi:hypothetical protein
MFKRNEHADKHTKYKLYRLVTMCIVDWSMIKHGEYQNLLTLSKIIGYKYVLNLFVPWLIATSVIFGAN